MGKEAYLNNVGEFLSKNLGQKIVEWEFGRFGIRLIGRENLHSPSLKKQTFIVAGTHVKPKLPFATSGMAPDGFITAKTIQQETQREISGVINYGYDLPDPFKKFEKPLEHVSKGLIKGIGAIPVNHVAGRINVNFFRELEKAIEKNIIILIYPLGMYYEDFDLSQKIEQGTAYIAKKYNLPVVVMYARNCNNWFAPNQDVDLVFDTPFLPKEMTEEQINQEIMQRFSKLQQGLKQSHP